MGHSPFKALQAKGRAVVAALYALERRLMIPLPIILGAAGLPVAVLCLILALVLRPGGGGLPFHETFDSASAEAWAALGGVWAVRDGTLVQRDAADAGKVTPLRIDAGQPYRYQARVRPLEDGFDGGLLFNMQQPGARAQSHAAHLSAETSLLHVIYGYFDDAGTFVAQGKTPVGALSGGADWQTLGVWVGRDGYHVLVNGRVVAANIPLQYRGGALGLMAGAATVFDDVSAEPWQPEDSPVAAEPALPVLQAIVSDPSKIGALLLSDRFDSAESEAAWQPLSGDWAFEAGALVQRQPDGFDHVASRSDTFESFALRAVFAHRQGAGGGVLFNMPHRDSLGGAHLIRYFGDGDILAWGYFDEQGAFVGQGSAAVPAAGDGRHMLEVRSGPETYAISLDGVLVAADVPLANRAGHIGLTSSQSAVVFESVEVYALGDGAAGSSVLLDLSGGSGQWLGAGGAVIQASEEPADFVAGVGLQGSVFRVSVEVLLPAGEAQKDVGGGIVFHMADREDRSMGQAARLASGGAEVVWGRYDASGAFEEQGRAALEAEPGAVHTLTLAVRGDNYDILVDGELIVSRLLAARDAGWIGLDSFRGPATFSNFRLTLGAGEG